MGTPTFDNVARCDASGSPGNSGCLWIITESSVIGWLSDEDFQHVKGIHLSRFEYPDSASCRESPILNLPAIYLQVIAIIVGNLREQ